ncbi:hypothetical protein [Vibrio neonatus]|uniref:hypothetical protein n=1 Tax=Vibrio neonatus TaxID=278860 RepID=UPI0021C3A29E|nr:hypothetical protein [Vibrio neonatus]
MYKLEKIISIFLALIFSLSVPLANASSFSTAHLTHPVKEANQTVHLQMSDCESLSDLHHAMNNSQQLADDCLGLEQCGHTCCQTTGGNTLFFSELESKYVTLNFSLSEISTYRSKLQRGVHNSLYRPPIS